MKRIVNALGKLSWGKRACAVFALSATTAIVLHAQTFTTLHSLDGTDGEGENPVAALVQATNGDLYGTTGLGGANAAGTVFKITPSGTLTTFYSFCSQSGCTDGSRPYAGLIQATNGDFYGTTYFGGGAKDDGTVFKITPSGALRTLYSFCSQSGCTDGGLPDAGLVQAANGNFYGTTDGGGANAAGTVFKITTGGKLTTLYSFCAQSGCTDGQYPDAGLIQATNGDFYGTTSGSSGVGTVFKITTGGKLTTLHSFCSQSGCTDGQYPYAGLVQATNGDFYGTTSAGGASGHGTVFKITPSGALRTLYSFCSQSGCTDGSGPYAGLIQATNGDLYGTTEYGGAYGYGTVFEMTPGGTLTTLYSFCAQSGCTDGQYPYAGLVQDTNGTFYGTTEYGGAYGDGTIFTLSVGLGPFVRTLPTSGKVGAAVKILGTGLTGSTSVTFNGTAATFTVVSASEITTTVPVGATTGTAQVVTPSATLSSNVPFQVNAPLISATQLPKPFDPRAGGCARAGAALAILQRVQFVANRSERPGAGGQQFHDRGHRR
ncbi:MAG: choice-of-anchor tandem repeat GloVer-containing protein [Bryobacteraceae bacterium]